MRPPTPLTGGDPASAGHVDRPEAARLLRAARDADRLDHDEHVDWAFTVMPDSPGAQRLKVQQLLALGHYEAADAVIARGLRRRPLDCGLTLLRARSLHAQGRDDAAQQELRYVLSRRPEHRDALELAGRVCLDLGEPQRAVRVLESAERRRPDNAIRELLANAWLAAGRPAEARSVVERMTAPTAMLRARVLEAEGRALEAIDVLERAREHTDGPDLDDITTALIELLERAAGLQRLRRLLAPMTVARPAILARAGLAWLAFGAYHAAATRMFPLRRVAGFRSQALTVMMVAAAMLNRPTLSRRALQRLRRLDEPVDRRLVAEAWCRGLQGRLILDQCSARRAGADPDTGRLHRMLRDAATLFQERLAGEAVPAAEQRELRRHLAACEQVVAISAEPADQATPPVAAMPMTGSSGLAA